MPRPRTGTLVQRMRDGRLIWHAQLTVDLVDGGTTRDWYSLETEDKEVARRKLRRLTRDQTRRGPRAAIADLAARPDTVAEYAKAWSKQREAEGVRTARDEKRWIDDYVLPTLGPMPLDQVRASHVRAVLEAARTQSVKHPEKGLKRASLANIRGAMNRLFGAAWREEVLSENPVARVRTPKMREVKKSRAILTDEEFAIFLAHVGEEVEVRRRSRAGREYTTRNFIAADVELKILALISRTLGGARTGDLNKLAWTAVDTKAFETVTVPRSKTLRPQTLEVPEPVRPFLRAWWERAGQPTTGPVFPARRGRNAGGFKTENGMTYAQRLRRDLRRALVAHRAEQARLLGVALDEVPEPRRELFEETETTLSVDFHSFRRAYNTALAEAGTNVQQAMALASHSDPKVHARYVMSTKAMRTAPEKAIPALPRVEVLQRPVAIQSGSAREEGENAAFLEPPSRLELETYGLRNRCSTTELRWPDVKTALLSGRARACRACLATAKTTDGSAASDAP